MAKNTFSLSNIEKYYNKFHEEHRLETRHGLVEFKTSMHYIREGISSLMKEKAASGADSEPASFRILDLGAGTGRYSVALSKEGYDLTAVELVRHNLEILRSKHENVKTWQGDARNLHFLDSDSFDLTLLFGPLYHLHGEENKLKALNEAKRVTKNGGIILVAYVMNEYSVISYCFKEHKWKEVLQKGGLSSDFHVKAGDDELYDYVRIEDIDSLNEKAGLERIKIISADGAADYMRRELNEMSEEEFSAFCTFQLAVCERKDLIGASSHTVDILRVKK